MSRTYFRFGASVEFSLDISANFYLKSEIQRGVNKTAQDA
jgi:hypothetical protein